MLETIKKIRKFSKQEGVDLLESKENNFIYSDGSTFVYIITKEGEPEEWIYFISLVVKDAQLDIELLDMLLRLNATLPFGAFGLTDEYIIFKHSILGGKHVDREEFFQSLYAVAKHADSFDDDIISIHGGKRAIDVLMDDLFKSKKDI